MSKKIIALAAALLTVFSVLVVTAYCEDDTAAETEIASVSGPADAAALPEETKQPDEASDPEIPAKPDGAIKGAEESGGEINEAKGGDAVTEAENTKEQPVPLVIFMGIGVVFFGLICIVLICMIMGKIAQKLESKTPSVGTAPAPSAAAPVGDAISPEKRRELIAAISAVIAEELGTDVSAIRVTSFRKIR